MRFVRLLVALSAAAFLFLVDAVSVSAQSIILSGATPGETAALVVNGQPAGAATVDAAGHATLAFSVLGLLHKQETGVRLAVDTCVGARRVQLSEEGITPAEPDTSCTRKSVPDLFSIQPVTSLMVDVDRDTPGVWIRQGPVPASWLDSTQAPGGHTWRAAPTGLQLSAGAGGVHFADASAQACGDAAVCSGQSMRGAAAGDVTYWVAPFVAADLGYLFAGRATATGSGTATGTAPDFSFNSTLEARIVTVTGKVGGQVGPVRIYGIGGANFSTATSTTIQTAAGGTPETFAFRAQGWGWVGGGGAEFWLTSHFAVYGEGNAIALKGAAIDNRQGSLNDTLIVATGGVRFALRSATLPIATAR